MLVNFKAFLGSTLTFAIIGTIVSVLMGVPALALVIFLNGLFGGAIISGAALVVNNFIMKKSATDFTSLAISTSIVATLMYFLFAMQGMNGANIIGIVVTIVYALIAAFAGTTCARFNPNAD